VSLLFYSCIKVRQRVKKGSRLLHPLQLVYCISAMINNCKLEALPSTPLCLTPPQQRSTTTATTVLTSNNSSTLPTFHLSSSYITYPSFIPSLLFFHLSTLISHQDLGPEGREKDSLRLYLCLRYLITIIFRQTLSNPQYIRIISLFYKIFK
jgi:hypothetical protein